MQNIPERIPAGDQNTQKPRRSKAILYIVVFAIFFIGIMVGLAVANFSKLPSSGSFGALSEKTYEGARAINPLDDILPDEARECNVAYDCVYTDPDPCYGRCPDQNYNCGGNAQALSREWCRQQRIPATCIDALQAPKNQNQCKQVDCIDKKCVVIE